MFQRSRPLDWGDILVLTIFYQRVYCNKALPKNIEVLEKLVSYFEQVYLATLRVWVRRRGCIESWRGKRRERDHWGDLGVDGWIILRRISRRWDVVIWTGLGWPRVETVGRRL